MSVKSLRQFFHEWWSRLGSRYHDSLDLHDEDISQIKRKVEEYKKTPQYINDWRYAKSSSSKKMHIVS